MGTPSSYCEDSYPDLYYNTICIISSSVLFHKAGIGFLTWHGGRDEVVEVSIGGGSEFERAEADVVESLVVDAVGLVCVLHQLVHRQSGVVWFHDCVRNLQWWGKQFIKVALVCILCQTGWRCMAQHLLESAMSGKQLISSSLFVIPARKGGDLWLPIVS